MDELVALLAAWTAIGTLNAGAYAVVWAARPRLLHVVVWPLVNAYMLAGATLPDRLRPAPRDRAAGRRRAALTGTRTPRR